METKDSDSEGSVTKYLIINCANQSYFPGNESMLFGEGQEEQWPDDKSGNWSQDDYGNWSLFNGNWSQDYGNWSAPNGNWSQNDYGNWSAPNGNWSQKDYGNLSPSYFDNSDISMEILIDIEEDVRVANGSSARNGNWTNERAATLFF